MLLHTLARWAPMVVLATIAHADELADALDEMRVHALVATLEGRGDEEKGSAAIALASLGGAGLPALIRGLDADGPATRAKCVIALRDTTHPAAALPRLFQLLDEATDERERMEIAQTLTLFGDVAQRHVAFYLGATSGNNKMPRRFAYLGLARLGPTDETIPVMIDGLIDSDPEIQAAAAGVLAPKDWLSMRERWRLGDRCGPVPWWSLWSDPEFSEYRSAVLDRLVPLLRHTASDVRALAANGLARADKSLSDGALRALRGALEDTDEEVRWRAATALAHLAEHGLAPQGALLSMLESMDDNQQCAGARAAWRLGGDAAWAKGGLKRTWEAPASLDARVAAAAALGKLGNATDEIVGQIAAAYAAVDPWDTNRFVRGRREELADWLRASQGAYSILIAAATGERRIDIDYWYRGLDQQDAVRALEAFPARKGETIRLLQHLLDDADSWDVRLRAAELLHRFGVAKEAYEGQLGQLIETAQAYSLVIATELLLRASPASQRPVPRLLRALSETSPVAGGQPFEVAQLLARIGHLPPTAKIPLLRAARGDEPRLRIEAVRALGHLADPDEEVRSFLWASLDAGSDARGAAAESLGRIVRSPADIERLLVGARGLGSRWFDAVAADPTRAPAALETLARMARDDGKLPSIVAALDAIAPRSAIAREVHLRLVRLGHAPGSFVDRGARDFVAPLVRQLLVQRSRCHDTLPSTAEALLRVANPDDLARLVAVLEDLLRLPQTRAAALLALGDMGPRAAAAVPVIRELEADAELGDLARFTHARISR